MPALAASNLPTTPKRPSPEPIIRAWRWRIGLSREGLAQALSVILSIVSRWEYGHLKPSRTACNARRQAWREEHRDRLRAYNREYQR